MSNTGNTSSTGAVNLSNIQGTALSMGNDLDKAQQNLLDAYNLKDLADVDALN